MRKGLGEESLEKEFKPRLARIIQLIDFAKRYAPSVHDDYVNQINNIFQTIGTQMNEQANRNSSEFISQRQTFLSNIDSNLEQSNRSLPYFVTAAVVERGFLSDEGIKQEYERTIQDMRSATAATLDTVKAEAVKAVQGAKDLADQIEARAHLTATGISVAEAQKQFSLATVRLNAKVKLWGKIVIASLVAIVIAPALFMLWPLPPNCLWPEALYHTLLRILILTAVAGVLSFSIRVFRAHLHMVEKNEHRVRVANSIESFVNSAIEPQQRDLILAKLVESIVDFGDSGMIRHEKDDAGSSTMSADFVGRILSSLASKKG